MTHALATVVKNTKNAVENQNKQESNLSQFCAKISTKKKKLTYE